MIKTFTVDAFTDKMFSGNPAAVCLLENDLDDKVMQSIAAEMNLSETAFVKKINEGFSLRWFTPKSEVELCGHATLASAHILWQEGILKPDEEAVFHTVFKGKLTAKKTGDEIELNFPVNIPIQSDEIPELEKALGVKPVWLGITDNHYLVELKSEEELKNVSPDFELLEKLEKYGTILTCRSENKDIDFISRFFAPAKGVKEDPVTGSAHCVLTPYWYSKLYKKTMKAFQASERGGNLTVTYVNSEVLITGKGDNFLKVNQTKGHLTIYHKRDRILIAGKAVTVLKGNLMI